MVPLVTLSAFDTPFSTGMITFPAPLQVFVSDKSVEKI